MKTTLFYVIAFLLVTFGISKFLAHKGKAFGPFLQTKTTLDEIASKQIVEVLPGSWDMYFEISNKTEKLKLEGEVNHHLDGSFTMHYTLTGKSPDALEFGSKFTGGGRLKGQWKTSEGLAVWVYHLTDCTYETSHYRHPYSYFDICEWLSHNVGLSFGNHEDKLGNQIFTHFSKNRLIVEENRFSETGTRRFTFTRKNK